MWLNSIADKLESSELITVIVLVVVGLAIANTIA